jgi:hypothetical protein
MTRGAIRRRSQLVEVAEVLESDINVSEIWIEGRSAPVSTADPIRQDNSQLRSVLRIATSRHYAAFQFEQLLAMSLVLRSHFRHFVRLECHSRQRWRLHRERLRRPVRVTGLGLSLFTALSSTL